MMKGLFVKDIQLTLANGRFLLILVLLIAVLSFSSPDFAITYAFLVSAIFSVRTISYDEADHGFLYLFSWPIRPFSYVLEKFLFSLGTGIILSLGTGLLLLLFEQISLWQLETSLFSGWLSIVLVASVYIPVQLKFGTERASLFFVLLFGGMVAAGVLLGSDSGFTDSLAGVLSGFSEQGLLGALWLISLLLIVLSVWISTRILLKKDF